MKKLIIGITVLLILGGIVFFCSTLRISLTYNNEGELTGEGGISITFSGSNQYTDEELSEYLFDKEIQLNPFVFWWRDNFGEHVEIPFIEEYDVEMKGLTSFEVTFYDKSVVGYIEYMGSYKYFDKDGIVVESSAKLLPDIPYITGIDVDYIVLHSKLPVADDKIFDVLLDVTQLISKYNIEVERINISKDMDIKLYMDTVRVELGKNEHLSEKMIDLRDIAPELKGVSGVLDMKVYNPQGTGYTLKKDE